MVTISRDAVPLKVGTDTAAEVAGVCVLTGILDLIFYKCLCAQSVNHCINRVLNKRLMIFKVRTEYLARIEHRRLRASFQAGVRTACCLRLLDQCQWHGPLEGNTPSARSPPQHQAPSIQHVLAIEVTFTLPIKGLHTPRTCLLRSASAVLNRSPDKERNVEEEMKGGRLGESPCLPP